MALCGAARGVFGKHTGRLGVRCLSASLDASQLTIERTTSPKAKQPKEELAFGASFTDHLLEVDWDADAGWHAPRIIPYGDFAVDPAASVFHYGIECFEGMKAYVDAEERIRMFRPDCNMQRMNDSMTRLFMPSFDADQYIECMKELLKLEKDWIPRGEGYSLYMRPTAISTHPYVGVGPTKKAKLYTILSPVGPYYPSGFAPVKLLADDKYVRAWPGGTGNTKVGGNYGPTILPQMEAAEKGYTQVLWLFGEDHLITEVGTMNLFFLWEKPDGSGAELVTPPLERGDILPGVTRRSVLELVRGWGEVQVSERECNMAEVVAAVDEGRMIESFGTGTAAVLCPVSEINYNGTVLSLPLKSGGVSGELCQRLWDAIAAIQYGKVEHEWSVLVD
eukprot:g1605.t1